MLAGLRSQAVAEERVTGLLTQMIRSMASHSASGSRSRGWRKVFQALDTEGGGAVSVATLREVVGAYGSQHDRSEIEAVIKRFDRNRSGMLTYPDFETMITTLLRIPHDKVLPRSSSIAQPQRYSTDSIWLSSLRNIGGSQVATRRLRTRGWREETRASASAHDAPLIAACDGPHRALRTTPRRRCFAASCSLCSQSAPPLPSSPSYSTSRARCQAPREEPAARSSRCTRCSVSGLPLTAAYTSLSPQPTPPLAPRIRHRKS